MKIRACPSCWVVVRDTDVERCPTCRKELVLVTEESVPPEHPLENADRHF